MDATLTFCDVMSVFVKSCLAAVLTLGFSGLAGAKTLDFDAPPTGLSDGAAQSVPQASLNAGARRASEILARSLRDTANLGGIEDLMVPALERDPKNHLARSLLAIVRGLAGDLDAARAVFGTGPERPLFGAEDALARAVIARGAGDFDAARAALTDALTRVPDHAYAHNLLGSLTYQQSGAAEAVTHFRAAARYGAEGATYWANLGAVLAETGDQVGAQAALRRAVALDPSSCPTLIGLARLEQANGNAATAAARYQGCLDNTPDNRTAAIGLVTALIEADDLTAAQSALVAQSSLIGAAPILSAEIALRQGDRGAVDAALSQVPPQDKGRAAALVARRALMDGDLSTAQVALASADGTTANSAAVTAGLAALQLARGQRLTGLPTDGANPAMDAFFAGLSALVGQDDSGSESVAAFTGAEDLVPGFRIDGLSQRDMLADIPAQAASGLAVPVYLMLTNTRGAAFGQLSELARAHPQSALIAYLAGYAATLDGQGLPVEQLALLDAAIDRAPRFFAAHVLRSEALLRTGRAVEALSALQSALEARQVPSIALRAGALAEALGDEVYAEAAYRQFVAAEPDSFIGLNQLAWFLASRDRDLTEAARLAGRAAELQPGNAAIEDTLGWIAYREGNLDAAIGHLEAAVSAANGRMPDVVLNLVEVRLARGEVDAAQTALDTVREALIGTPLEPRVSALQDSLRAAQ